MNTRTQLSLYVPQSAGAALEALRRLLDPVQARLIPAHVTLCREDEIADRAPALLAARLMAARAGPLTLGFGRPEPSYAHGVLLPCVAGEEKFHALRRWVLGADQVRYQAPHITLAHPRNPKSPDNHRSHYGLLPDPLTITFPSIYRIRQHGSDAWELIDEYELAGSP